MISSAVQIDNLICRYKSTGWQLGPVSINFNAAKLTGIIGPNGSGKSTFVSALARKLDFEGEIKIGEMSTENFSSEKWANIVAYLPQRIPVQFDFSVEQTVAFGRFAKTGLMGFLEEADHNVIEKCLKQTDLLALRHRMLSELSGGELQRTHLASVLVQEPEILLLDEPTSSLDIHHQIEFYGLIRECVDGGMTAIVVTHELTLAAHFCDELVLLSDGKLMEHNIPEKVIREDLIREVYGEKVCVLAHPETGRPMVVPEIVGNP